MGTHLQRPVNLLKPNNIYKQLGINPNKVQYEHPINDEKRV